MKIIQTLYANNNLPTFSNRFGWLRPEYHLMSWALSCLQIKKFHKEVHLYANTSGADLLVNQLKLPYDSVNISHDSLVMTNENLWALPKIFTYSLQKEPFLHIDGDVFLFEAFPDDFLEKDLIAQNIEEATKFYQTTQTELMSNFEYFPDCVRKDFYSEKPINAVNAGILGGQNIRFFQNYTDLAFTYIENNADNLPKINVNKFNVFFEQHLFYSLAVQEKIPISVLFNEKINDNEYEGFGNFHEVPFKRHYLHLLGTYKNHLHTCMQMANKLRQLHPNYYYQIITLCKQNDIQLLTDCYADSNLSTLTNYQKFHNKAKNIYQNLRFLPKKTQESRDLKGFEELDNIEKIITLKNIINQIDYTDKPFTKNELQADFQLFAEKIAIILKQHLSTEYLYGRDIEAGNWYSLIFEHEKNIQDVQIIKCNEPTIITSDYDWANILNKVLLSDVRIRFYESFEISKGNFNTLIVPEVYIEKFSLYDMENMDVIILQILTKSMTIKDLFIEIQQYFDADVIKNHAQKVFDFLIVLLKQLVLKKAIMPVNL
jgi:hypothetical protein